MNKSRRFYTLSDTNPEGEETTRLRRWYYAPFRTLMRDYCEWYQGCDSWGSAMKAAFIVSDYLASNWSEYPMGYKPGLGGAGSIIEEEQNMEVCDFLSQFDRETIRTFAAKLERYTSLLKHAKRDY